MKGSQGERVALSGSVLGLGFISSDDEQAQDFVMALPTSTFQNSPEEVNGANADDFDSALDTIFKVFSEDTVDSELRRAEETYNALTEQEQGLVQIQSVFQAYPTVVKSDFRKCFPRMYMNTLNSGDFDRVQDYYHTFMTSSTNFVAVHNQLNPNFGIPEIVRVCGPQLTIHYLLGASVMFPDLVMQMRDTRITTSTAWKGSRIEMDVEFLSTKMYDLPIDEWLPPRSALDYKYQTLVEKKRKLLAACDVSASASFQQLHLSETPAFLPVAMQGVPTVGYTADSSPSSAQNKRKSGEIDAAHAVAGSDKAQSCTHLYTRQPRVPVEYIHSLQARAKVVPVPLQLHTKGTITMFLDENNYIQHMNLNVVPG